MKRGDIIKVVSAREYGKPRPSLVVQADAFDELAGVVICPLTSDLADPSEIRVRIAPDRQNGLLRTSDIMVDKVSTISKSRCREKIGAVDQPTLDVVSANLALLLGLTN